MRVISFLLLLSLAYGQEEVYKINVSNECGNPLQVYFFTHPAHFNGQLGITNSLATKTVHPNQSSQAQFTYHQTFFAAAAKLVQEGGSNGSTKLRAHSVTMQQIGLKSVGVEDGMMTELGIDEHQDAYLTTPTNIASASAHHLLNGALLIQTRHFVSGSGSPQYGVGLGTKTNGHFQLGTHTIASPGMDISVQPVIKFYIQVGNHEIGTEVNFDSQSQTSAVCDATHGTKTFDVVRTSNGHWRVNGVLQA